MKNLYLLSASLAFASVSCTTHHYDVLDDGDFGYKDRSFYEDRATDCIKKEYPKVDLSVYTSPIVSRRSDLRRLYSRNQVSVSWSRVTDEKRLKDRNNPIPMEHVEVNLTRNGEVHDHSHSYPLTYMHWAPNVSLLQNKTLHPIADCAGESSKHDN